MKTADTLDFDANGALTAHSGQGSAQTYTYVDPFGACYDRAVTTAAGVLVSIVDGASCPSGVNALSWFDAFHTYASVLTGATVQILP